jgi:hypothetical protein
MFSIGINIVQYDMMSEDRALVGHGSRVGVGEEILSVIYGSVTCSPRAPVAFSMQEAESARTICACARQSRNEIATRIVQPKVLFHVSARLV